MGRRRTYMKEVRIKVPVDFRAYREGDEGRVYGDWLHSYEHVFLEGKHWPYERSALESAARLWHRWQKLGDGEEKKRCLGVLRRLYFSEHHRIIDAVRHGGQVLVCCSRLDDGQIYGWVAWEPGELHYVYVAELYRDAGIGSELVRRCGALTSYSHRTEAGEGLRRKLSLPAQFQPRVSLREVA
jgi:GNAT superfamily N-acetyltransferase